MIRRWFMMLSIFAATAFGHDTWLAPDQFHMKNAGVVRLTLTSGMGFPALDVAITKERVANAAVRTARGLTLLKQLEEREHALELQTRLNTPGVAVLWVSLKPRTIELKPEQVSEYLDEIGAKESVGSMWAAMPEPKRWREEYVKHAKTFVRIGSARSTGWAKPVGQALEFVPDEDPTTRRAGQHIHYLLLGEGKPLANFPVSVVRAGGSPPLLLETDAAGRVEITLPEPGQYMVKATRLRRSGKENVEWNADFATATFQVLP